MIEILFNWITAFISWIGYFGIFVLMILESMIFPVPSEAVMPFAGYLTALGRFDFLIVLIVATIGTITGSLISYYIGMYGNHIIRKYHKIFLLNEHHLDYTQMIFNKYGSITIFVSRFIPIIRHLISIPAGMGKMNLKKFLIYTLFGGLVWNFILLYAGYILADQWIYIRNYSRIFDIIILILIISFVTYILLRKKFKTSSGKQASLQ